MQKPETSQNKHKTSFLPFSLSLSLSLPKKKLRPNLKPNFLDYMRKEHCLFFETSLASSKKSNQSQTFLAYAQM